MATQKTKKTKKPTSLKLDELTGHDARNGRVTMRPEIMNDVKGYRVNNERTDYTEFSATRQAAIADYNRQINNSHRQ